MAEGTVCCDINDNRETMWGDRYFLTDIEEHPGDPIPTAQPPDSLVGYKCVIRAAAQFSAMMSDQTLEEATTWWSERLGDSEPSVAVFENQLLDWVDEHSDHCLRLPNPTPMVSFNSNTDLGNNAPRLVALVSETEGRHLVYINRDGVIVDIFNPSDDNVRWFVDRWWSMCGCQPNR